MKRTTTGWSGGRPEIQARRGVVTSGHYLATEAGIEILRRGGNAFDAAAAVGFMLAVVQPHQHGIGGEVPMVIYSSVEKKVWTISGNGVAPRAATLERFREMGLRVIPGDGFLGAIVPSAPASWILLLQRFGTMKLQEVLSPAIEMAEDGIAMYDTLARVITKEAQRFRTEWPASAGLYLPGGEVPKSGTVWRNPDWARSMRGLVEAEKKHSDRKAGLEAARETFYEGEIARRMVEFSSQTAVRDASGKSHRGLLTQEDFAAYRARIEEPVRTTYRGVEVNKCGAWTQGPAMLQTLNILEAFDLRTMGLNSVDYMHTLIEAMKLAYADREFYYGDPEFADVPMERLLSKEYSRERSGLIDRERASMQLRPGGHSVLEADDIGDVDEALERAAGGPGGDTTKLEVIDRTGNVVSATPSGGWLESSPVVPGLGFCLGTRGQMFSLSAGHPNGLQPGKRPRTTLTPTIATRHGKPWLAFGSPGGDNQDQWALQFLLNVMEFGMGLQEAVEAPTFWTEHFPSSFYPRSAKRGSLIVDRRIPEAVRVELTERGHIVTEADELTAAKTLAVELDSKAGVLRAAASPRLEPAYAAGW